jgi:hypothetical protein
MNHNHFNTYKWVLKHSEDIGGACIAMIYNLLGGTFSLLNIDLYLLAERLVTDAPGMFLAGFMGGLGGFTIRLIISYFSKKNPDEKGN